MTDPTFIIFMNLVNFLAPFLKKLWGWALSAVITRSFAVDGEARSSAKCRSKAKCRSDPKWGESYDPSGSVLPACPGKKCWIFFLPRMVGYHDTMIGGGLPKPGNSGKNYNHHDFPEGPLWDFITHSFSDWPHETERKVLGHPNETLCEQSQLSGQLVLVLFRLANASDVCPCSFWLKAGDHKCHRSVPFASWKYMSLYIYIYTWKLQLSWPSKSDFISVSHQDWLRFTWSKWTSTFSSLSGFKLKVLRDDLEMSSHRCAQPCPVNSYWPPYNVIPHKICSNFEITRSVRRIGAKKIWFSTDFQLRSKASLKSATSAALKLSSEDMEVTSARGCQAQALRPTQPTSCGLLEEHPKKCLSGSIQQMALEAVSLDLEEAPFPPRLLEAEAISHLQQKRSGSSNPS